jgi:hypothetical protein
MRALQCQDCYPRLARVAHPISPRFHVLGGAGRQHHVVHGARLDALKERRDARLARQVHGCRADALGGGARDRREDLRLRCTIVIRLLVETHRDSQASCHLIRVTQHMVGVTAEPRGGESRRRVWTRGLCRAWGAPTLPSSSLGRPRPRIQATPPLRTTAFAAALPMPALWAGT